MWITGDVNLPQAVMDAHADGKLVFFVGAGASMDAPSDLPSFEKLAKLLAERAAHPFSAKGGLDYFLGTLPAGFDTHRHVRDLIARPDSTHNLTHSAIVELASSSGTFRVVTTNFDTHLSAAAVAAGVDIPDTWHGPALPLGSDYTGLVHLHGAVTRSHNELVVTDRDFGRAYLTQAWAARFLLPMFDTYTVVFIGYSHEDTIMRYLSLGLPSQTQRYAFTSEPQQPKWKHLGIETIEYTQRESHDHGNLVVALQTWASRAKMGRLEHEMMVRDIIDAGPQSVTPVDRDYLVAQLKTEEGARRFAAVASSLDWLRWMESIDDFRALFNGGEDAERSATLASWFASNFVNNADTSDAALATVRRLGQRFSPALFNAMSLATARLATDAPADAQRWKVLLLTSIDGHSAPRDPGALLRFRRSDAPESRAFVRAMLRPSLALERSWVLDDDSNARPNVDVRWAGRPRDLHSVLESAAGNAEAGDENLLTLLEDALNAANEIVAAYLGGTTHSAFRHYRPRIAGQQDRPKKHIDAIIDALRDAGARALPHFPLLPERWWSFEHSIFQRLAIHLVAEDPQRSTDDKVRWLLQHHTLYTPGTKPETFRILAERLTRADPELRAELLKQVAEGPTFPDDVEERERHVAYSIFNILIWITRHTPDWVEAQRALAEVREAHPTFAAREEPDQDVTISSGTWGGKLPMDADEFADRAETVDVHTAVRAVLDRDYSERHFDEPTWDDALELFAEVAGVSATLGVDIADALNDVSEATPAQKKQILEAVARGWQSGDLTPKTGARVIATLSTPSFPPRSVTRFLLAQVRRLVGAGETEFTRSMRELASRTWTTHRETFVVDVHADSYLHLNSWPGDLVTYWLTETDRQWRNNRASWSGLDHGARTGLGRLLAGPDAIRAAAEPAAARELYFLFAADELFATQHVIPLFASGENVTDVWKAFLHNPRVDARLLGAGLLDAIEAQWYRLPDLDDDALTSQFLSLVAWIASFGGVTSGDRKRILTPSVLANNGAYAAGFAAAVLHQLETEGVDGKEIWDSWLSEHVAARRNGIPRNASPDELERWADTVPYLDTAIPAAVDLFEDDTPGFSADYDEPNLTDETLDAHGEALLRHLAKRAANTASNDLALSYVVTDVIAALRPRVPPALLQPLVDAATQRSLLDTSE